MSNSINPYVAGPPVRLQDFVGRERIIDKILSGLQSLYPISTSVVGDRRVGKTSLLRYLSDSRVCTHPEGCVFAFSDVRALGRPLDEASFFCSLAREIKRQAGLGDDVQDRETFRGLLEDLTHTGKRVVLLLDEFDAVYEEKAVLDLADFTYFLRSLMSSELATCVVASVKPLNELDPARIASPFNNAFSVVRLGLFEPQEAEQLVVRSASSGISLLPYVDLLLDLSGCHPYLLQLVCQIAFDKAVAGQTPSEAELNEIEIEFFARARETFKHVLNQSDEWREALIALSDNRPLSRHVHTLRELAEYGYVLHERGSYRLFSRTFKAYIREWLQKEGLAEASAIVERQLLLSGKVCPDTLDQTSPAIRHPAIEKFHQDHPELDLKFDQGSGELSLQHRERWENTLERWYQFEQLVQGEQIPSSSELVCLTKAMLQSALELDTAEGAPQTNRRSIQSMVLDTERAFESTRLPAKLLVLFLTKPSIEEDNLTEIRHNVPPSLSPRTVLLVLAGNQVDVQRTQKLLDGKLKTAFAVDVIAVGRDDLLRFSIAKDAHRALRQLLLNEIDLRTISPYVTTGPTPDNVFVGRQQELRQLSERLGTASAVIVGGRRIGKTSILNRLYHRLEIAGSRPFYLDCSPTPGKGAFLKNIACLCFGSGAQPKSSLTELVMCLPQDRPIVFLLDEVDKLIDPDRQVGYPLFTEIRTLTQSGCCRFVLCGEYKLSTALRDPEGPLFNLATVQIIGRLDSHAVRVLVTHPMRQLEVQLIGEEDIVQRIYGFTSGHPNVVQRFCHKLILRLNERADRRLTLADVEEIIRDPGFVRTDFLETYWERATVLEKLASLVMVKNPQARLPTAVQSALQAEGVQANLESVHGALKRLVELRNILAHSPTGYTFAVTAFPEILSGSVWLQEWIAFNREIYLNRGNVIPMPASGIPNER